MDYSKVLPIIEKIVKNAIEQKRYKFGFFKYRGISNKVATGTLRDSVQVLKDKQDKIVVTYVDYGEFVLKGRLGQKGKVPIAELLKWIKARGLKGRDKKGRFITDKSFAFGIQTNISKKGIRPANWWDVAMEDLLANQEIYDYLGDSAIDDLIKILEEAV